MAVTVETRAIHISDTLNDLYVHTVKVPGFIDLPVILSQLFGINANSVVSMESVKRLGIKVANVTDETYQYGGLYAMLMNVRSHAYDDPYFLSHYIRDAAQEAASPLVSDFNEALPELLEHQIPIAQSPDLANMTLRELFAKGKYVCYFPIAAGALYGASYLAKGDIGMAMEVTAAGSMMSIMVCGTTSLVGRMLEWSKVANTAAQPLPTRRRRDGDPADEPGIIRAQRQVRIEDESEEADG